MVQNTVNPFICALTHSALLRAVAADGAFHIGRLYQDAGRYVLAIEAYDDLFEKFPQAFRRNDAVYNKAVCLETVREFAAADPYSLAGLFASVEVRPWNWTVGNPDGGH